MGLGNVRKRKRAIQITNIDWICSLVALAFQRLLKMEFVAQLHSGHSSHLVREQRGHC